MSEIIRNQQEDLKLCREIIQQRQREDREFAGSGTARTREKGIKAMADEKDELNKQADQLREPEVHATAGL